MEEQPTNAKSGAPPVDAAPEELSFDRADFGETAAASAAQCKACEQPIADAYYEVNGEVACDRCQSQAVALRTGGSALGRVARATIFGLLAGVVGAGIYYAILALTGYEVGLVSILVGFMVGFAVSFGSNQRGGWFYQLLAVGITYCSIVTTYVPMIVEGMREAQAEEAAAVAAAVKHDVGTAEALEEGLFDDGSATHPEAAPVTATEAPSADAATAEPAPVEELEFAELPDAVLWIIAVPLAFVAPFFGGFQNILGILIICFGLWQAWQMNRKQPFEVSGPFQVGAARAAP